MSPLTSPSTVRVPPSPAPAIPVTSPVTCPVESSPVTEIACPPSPLDTACGPPPLFVLVRLPLTVTSAPSLTTTTGGSVSDCISCFSASPVSADTSPLTVRSVSPEATTIVSTLSPEISTSPASSYLTVSANAAGHRQRLNTITALNTIASIFFTFPRPFFPPRIPRCNHSSLRYYIKPE